MKMFPGGWLPRLIALFPLLFPLYLARGLFMGVPVTLTELILGVLFFCFLFEHEPFRWQEWKLWPVGLFLLAAILGVAVVPQHVFMVDGTEFPAMVKALGILKGWIFAPVLYFVMARNVFREKPSLIPWALRAFFAGAVFLSVWALSQEWTRVFLTADGRASGPFESANYLSLYVGPAFLYGVFSAWTSSDKTTQWLLGFGSFLIGLGLYFSESYAAWIAVFGAGALGILILLRQRSRRLFYSAVVGAFVLGGAFLALQWNSPKFEQFIDFSGRSSSSVRIEVYTIAWHLIQEHPWLGIGLGQFEPQYQTTAVETLGHAPFEWNMLHPHNLFLAFYLFMGPLGLFAFLWLCTKALPWLFEKDHHERAIVALLLVEMLIHGLFDTPYFKNDLAFFFWMMMAILL